ncbi:hypothetical protein A3A48_03380 [Candidatus Curtissbacteria bacterium RIFCSPLOWO2_01_FULL_37_9]|uniref:DUF4012 domain-containing protein n=1 Tax=Candidatus Curtissbacteria bacterium RIFCSPLOWO2_01_FULL_37_9 TaxID=1797724 RepID=A0A1F5GST1_9BACT|nr:MAG: hypothetical protein A3A48_03380 [Candidatus Curtissbacteria bacterium RIFCSPLOWO2_01_FULL_37_9]
MKRKLVFALVIIFVILGILGTRIFFSAKKAFSTTKQAVGAAKLQNLDATKAYLKDARGEFSKIRTSNIVFSPLRYIPFVGWYIADFQRGINTAVYALDASITLADAMSPYADVLGLKGEGTFLGGTAQERLAKAIETLSIITPQIDQVGKDLALAKDEIDQVQTWRYPNFLPGKPAQIIKNAKDTIDQLETFVVDTKPLIEVLPEMMGQNSEKKYLILFQNDKELRPTGGFITAYAFFRLNNGVIASEGSQDIYQLDDSLLKKIPAPAPIIKYLPNVPNLNLRDSNLSPDFYVSMKQFEDIYQYTQAKKEIDGIIAVDTQFVVNMMEVLGPLDAYGSKFTTEDVDQCACPQIIYELEKYADEPVAYEKGSRKDIIGVLMAQMMDKAFNAPKSTWPNLLGTITNSLRTKHMLFYFNDKSLQEAAEKINFAGRLSQYDGDYLHINETNFAGAKSNLYVQEKVTQVINKDKSGEINKKVTVEYKYPRQGDNCNLERKGGLCLAGIYRDWIRFYVPKGSNLIKASGTEVPISKREEYDKTVFEGFFTIRPEGTAKIEIEYTVPLKLENIYKLLIQKQPGVKGHVYEIEAFGKKQKAFPLDTDKELIVNI